MHSESFTQLTVEPLRQITCTHIRGTRSRARRTVEANKSNLNFQIVQICSDLFRSFQIFCAGGWDAIKKKRKEKNKTEGRRNVSVEVLCTVSTFSAPWSVIASARSFQFFSDLLSISDRFQGIFPDGIDFTWLSQALQRDTAHSYLVSISHIKSVWLRTHSIANTKKHCQARRDKRVD